MRSRRKKQTPAHNELSQKPQASREQEKVARGVLEIAAALHDKWRQSLEIGDGEYMPDIETTTDEQWIQSHGGAQVDIANTSFEQLPSDWQSENLAAARVVLGLLLEGEGYVGLHRDDERERVGSIIHNEWLKRHPEAHAEGLDVPFVDLPWDQQDKDLNQANVGMQVWARMSRAEEADTGYGDDRTIPDPRTGEMISARELLDDVHAMVRQEEIARQAEAPVRQSKDLEPNELLKTSQALLTEVYETVKTWRGEKKVSEYRGKVYVRLFAKNARGDLCEALLIYNKGDDLDAQPTACQVTRFYTPDGGGWSREHYIDINTDTPLIRETSYPYHEEDLAESESNNDISVEKARHLIEQLPGYRDPTLA